jgi:hypothetical protein
MHDLSRVMDPEAGGVDKGVSHAVDVGNRHAVSEGDRGWRAVRLVGRQHRVTGERTLSVVLRVNQDLDASRCHLVGAVLSGRWTQALARSRRKCCSAMFAVSSAAWRNDVAASASRPRRARRSPRTAWRRW